MDLTRFLHGARSNGIPKDEITSLAYLYMDPMMVADPVLEIFKIVR